MTLPIWSMLGLSAFAKPKSPKIDKRLNASSHSVASLHAPVMRLERGGSTDLWFFAEGFKAVLAFTIDAA